MSMSWSTDLNCCRLSADIVDSEIVPDYDSDDSDAQGPVNTIGDIPLSFYDR
jgi:hypothetical protein